MLAWLKGLFKSEPAIKAQTPEDTCIYAVGDIHGRHDLLVSLQHKIIEDSKSRGSARKIIVYMGDYIDRGFESKEVVERLIAEPLEGFESIYLKGNHEDAMLRFLEAPEESAAWLLWGGDATLRSYGVAMHSPKGKRHTPVEMAKQLAGLLSEEHADFLKGLPLYFQAGDYVFVHAGLRPGVDLEMQTAEDMMSIREPFIFSRQLFPYTIVFGHTIFSEPFLEKDRIGIDTGAYASGKLTCAVFEGSECEFIHT